MPDDRLTRARQGYEGYVYEPPQRRQPALVGTRIGRVASASDVRADDVYSQEYIDKYLDPRWLPLISHLRS